MLVTSATFHFDYTSAVSEACDTASWICAVALIALALVLVAAIAAMVMAIAMIVLLNISNSVGLLFVTLRCPVCLIFEVLLIRSILR